MKTCSRCGCEKTPNAFGKESARKDALRNHCLLCESKRAAAYYVLHKEARKAYSQRRRDRIRKQRLKQANSGGVM
jgi:hypothetical protein